MVNSNLNSVFIILFVQSFSAIFKKSHMRFINKNVPARRDKMFIWEKNVPSKRDPEFMKVGSLLGGIIHFHLNILWFCNRMLLSGVISLYQGPHFAGIFFPHINTLLIWSRYAPIPMLLLYRRLSVITKLKLR